MKTLFPLPLRALFVSGILAAAAHAEPDPIPDTAARGPELAASVVSVTQSGVRLVTGNGDVGVAWEGGPRGMRFGIGKADFWGIVRGSITTVGHETIECPDLDGATMLRREEVGPALLTGSFSAPGGRQLACETWVAQPDNLVVTQLVNSGSAPLRFTLSLGDAFSEGLPGLTGSGADYRWLRVSADTVPFEIGNRLVGKEYAPFIGRIAGVELRKLGEGKPYLAWEPDAAYVRNVGSLKIIRGDEHGTSVEFAGEKDQRLVCRAGCPPQTGFSISAWVNATAQLKDGTIFDAVAVEKPARYPFLRGLVLHVADGRLEARLNYSTVTAPDPMPLNQWVKVEAVYDGKELTLLADGRKLGSAAMPDADDQMGWDKTAIHLGDPALPFHGCAPAGVMWQRVVGPPVAWTNGTLGFTLAPGAKASVLLAVVTDRNTPDYMAAAERLVSADEAAIVSMRARHLAWWLDFWKRSFVDIGDTAIRDTWYASVYLLACCSRAECPPPGLWYNFVTEPGASWDGDYTLDYNYQAPFWAGYATNHFELADNYEPMLIRQMSRARATARNAWRFSPVQQPKSLGEMLAMRTATPPAPNPREFHGLYFYTHLIPSPAWSDDFGTFWNQKSNAIFCAVNMAQRWRLTRDAAYGREVYDFLKETADFWDNYLVLQDGRYVDLDDSVYENSGPDMNPAGSLSFIKLVYPCLIELSESLGRDEALRPKWRDVLARLSGFTLAPAATIPTLAKLPPDVIRERVVIRNSEKGQAFPWPAYEVYHDHKERNSSAGMNSSQAIFPGWSFGIESSPAERKAALDTVTLAAEWFDANDDCTFYPSAAIAGYDPSEILQNLDTLIGVFRQPDLTFKTFGGGTEDVAIVPAALWCMFLQSHQSAIHVFPDWPAGKEATFAGLPACGGFTVDSRMRAGKVDYVRIASRGDAVCAIANPWPGAAVHVVSNKHAETKAEGATLKLNASTGEILTLTPAR